MSRKKATPAPSVEAISEQQPDVELALDTAVQPTEGETPADAETADNRPGEITEEEVHLTQASPGEQMLAETVLVPVAELALDAAVQLTEGETPADAETASNGPTEITEEEVHLIQPSPGEQIQDETVQVPVAAYTVNRGRLDHDGESYSYGAVIEIEDEKAAQVLLALGALVRVDK